MKTFKEFTNSINEAAPSDDIKSKMVYHGTTSRAAALGIAKNGIVSPEPPKKSNEMTPVEGKVYVTPHINYAQIYAMGGDVAGSNYQMQHHQHEHYGYVFGVHGHKLKDVQPDEDSVGEAVYKKSHPWLSSMAKEKLHPTTHKNIMEGEYGAWAKGGKQLVKKMSDSQKTSLIDSGAHIAHAGTLKPDAVYRIHKDKIPLLKKDGSNFFEHAEKIDPKDI
jgi:hypothetical protein